MTDFEELVIDQSMRGLKTLQTLVPSLPSEEELLAMWVKYGGWSHFSTLAAASNLAVSRFERGEHDLAIIDFKWILNKRRCLLGKNHTETIISQMNLEAAMKIVHTNTMRPAVPNFDGRRILAPKAKNKSSKRKQEISAEHPTRTRSKVTASKSSNTCPARSFDVLWFVPLHTIQCYPCSFAAKILSG
jgi:hypothetical protein